MCICDKQNDDPSVVILANDQGDNDPLLEPINETRRNRAWFWGIPVGVLAMGAIPFVGEILTLVCIVVFTTVTYGFCLFPSASDTSSTTAGSTPPPTNTKTRLVFLDRTKTFLVAVVVTFHVCCAFGACGAKTWFMTLNLYWVEATNGDGDDDVPRLDWFRQDCTAEDYLMLSLQAFVAINQAYFMPLFFFVSAYLAPDSVDRKGTEKFLQDRARRIYWPAMGITFGLTPACFILGQVGAQKFVVPFVLPHTGHAWFLFWLLVFNWCYCWIVGTGGGNTKGETAINKQLPQVLGNANPSSNDDCEGVYKNEYLLSSLTKNTSSNPLWPLEKWCTKLPALPYRWIAGWFVCGWCMLIVQTILWFSESFGGMPVAHGSVVNDAFFFYMGLLAKRNNWFDQGQLAEQLDVPRWLHYVFVLVEATVLVLLMPRVDATPGYAVAFFGVAGIFCVDMSVLVLEIFQTQANHPLSQVNQFFADAAYGVYVIHPIIIVGSTAIFVQLYNHLYSDNEEKSLEFYGFPICSESPLDVKDTTVGIFCVVILSHMVVWPIGWCMHRFLPSVF